MRDADGCWLYIVRCRDGSYYTGTTRSSVETRVGEHNAGLRPEAFTFHRRPVLLVFAEHFQQIPDAISMERRIKGWNRRKKEALIGARYDLLPELSKRGPKSLSSRPDERPSGCVSKVPESTGASFETAAPRPPQDEG